MIAHKSCTCSRFPAGFCFNETAQRKWLGYRRNHPAVGTFTALSQLMPPRSRILFTDFKFRLPDGISLMTWIC